MDRYLTGNKVYRGGSSAPTMGTVDPMGYIDREINKRSNMLSDPSQTRSGLAQAALQRLGTLTPSNPDTYGPQPTGTGSELSGAALGSGFNNAPIIHGTPTAQTLTPGLQSHIPAPPPPKPTVSSTGKISAANPAAPVPTTGAGGIATTPVGSSYTAGMQVPNTALPFDYQGSMDQINATDTLGQLMNQILAERQVAQRNYASGMHQLDMQQPIDERGLINQFAGRGLAHSSGYGVGYGNLENQYAGSRTSLADTLSQLLTQYGLQQAQGQGTYDQQMAVIKSAIAQRLAGQAGTLGLGK